MILTGHASSKSNKFNKLFLQEFGNTTSSQHSGMISSQLVTTLKEVFASIGGHFDLGSVEHRLHEGH